jgi:hypothetical protein
MAGSPRAADDAAAMTLRRLAFLATVAAGTVAVASAASTRGNGQGDAMPPRAADLPSFQLVFDGRHAPATFPTPSGLQHEGPFTSSASLCPAGSATDVGLGSSPETAVRRFTCAGGTGGFTANVGPLPAEHGGRGLWQIVDGSGAIATLRGRGTWTSVITAGNPADPATIRFRSTWQGVADLDDSPPAIAITAARARKLRRPRGAFRLRVGFTLHDQESPISYSLVVLDPRSLREWTRGGATTSGVVSLVVRARPAKRSRVLRLRISATDLVGNEAFAGKAVRIR